MNWIAKINEGLKVIMAVTLIFSGVCFGVAMLHMDHLLKKMGTEAKNVETTRKTLDDLLVRTTVLVVDADDAATKESKSIDNFNRQITTTLDSVNQSVVALTVNQNAITLHTVQTLDETKKSIIAIQPVLNSATVVLNSATATVSDLDKALPPILGNVQDLTKQSIELSKQSTDTMQHLNGTTGEVQQAVHSYLHPTWPHRVWSILTGIGLDAAKLFIP
jgi:hypothetical protein